jgi:PAS domain S-box-containing protein
LEKVANLSAHTVVFSLPVLKDGSGKKFIGNESLSQITRVSSAPVYSFRDVNIGTGIVGGYMSSFEEDGKAVAQLGLRILNGEQPDDIPITRAPNFLYMFDWRQLKRWSISEDSLPPGSIVKFKQLTIWDRYKGRIIGAIALFVLQALIILFLLQQRRIRRQAEEELLQTEQKYRTVADYTYDWEYWANIDGSLEYVSPSCERISGYSVQDFKENLALFREIIVHEDRKSWDTHALKSEKELKPGEIQFRILRKDGELRWIEHLCQPVTDPQGTLLGLRASNRDITARKQAELDTQRHRVELTHVSRVVTLGELSASLAHELNQPLTAILSNAQAARRFLTGYQADPDEVNEILNDIINDDKRAADIIKRLRALMARKELAFTSLDLNKVVRGIAELVNHEAFTKNVSLVLDLAQGLPHVQGDVIHLQQVALNLIINGTEAMETVDHQSRELRILTAKHGENAVRVSVRDQGTGIDEDHITGIFEAFHTTKPEGMGMGLSICRSIIEAHDGRLWAENNPDQGATVSFTIPVNSD